MGLGGGGLGLAGVVSGHVGFAEKPSYKHIQQIDRNTGLTLTRAATENK